ncbi:DUF4150 domain-containing protein [Enterobacteriaceae bacterium Kacie_13]|nr:DUF4150 domain-containing protein [Enterobacteriaceae bacterium Kacie_13]
MAEKHIGSQESQYRVISTAPDVCMVGDVPVPFDSFQDLSHIKSYVTNVRARGKPILTVGSVIAGTQSNAGKGISSGTSLNSGDCTIMTGVPHIKCKGMPVARQDSLVAMNNGNTVGKLYTQVNPANGEIPVTDNLSLWEMVGQTQLQQAEAELEASRQTPDIWEGMGKGFVNGWYMLGHMLGKAGMLNGTIEADQQMAFINTMGINTSSMEAASELNKAVLQQTDTNERLLELDNEAQEVGADVEAALELLFLVKGLVQFGIKGSVGAERNGVKVVEVLDRIPISRNSARKLLKSRGLNKNIQHETINSFNGQIYASKGRQGDIFTITEHIPGSASQVYLTRGSAGLTSAERRSKLALPPGNSATYEGKVSLTRNQVLLEGKVSPQPQWGEDKTGDGWQVVTAGGKYSGATKRL